ncbi:MAG: MerR family transcriptional regulator [Nitrospinae bacterium]|nr:MerR family transcriptional regulator [Nitrospinota bacterium]
MPENIPDKLFFKIGEVARITEVEPHVLRYWESEFGLIRPNKSKTGQRVYKKKDIETILEIKRLLYEERFSIEGAKKRLFKKYYVLNNNEMVMETIKGLKRDLLEILSIMNKT